jgi:hypothetical protein
MPNVNDPAESVLPNVDVCAAKGEPPNGRGDRAQLVEKCPMNSHMPVVVERARPGVLCNATRRGQCQQSVLVLNSSFHPPTTIQKRVNGSIYCSEHSRFYDLAYARSRFYAR